MKTLIRIATFALGGAILAGCANVDRHRAKFPDPDDRVDHIVYRWNEAQNGTDPCLEMWEFEHATTDCGRLLREVERLYTEFPQSERVMMANGVLWLEAGRADKAAFYLDQLLSRRGANPDAAVLRARIALDDGNSDLAHRVVANELRLVPDHAELREVQAAAHYLAGNMDAARGALGIAGRLGAPGWRLSYHHGLICEAEEDWAAACRFYEASLSQRPDYAPARGRLIGLTAYPECGALNPIDLSH